MEMDPELLKIYAALKSRGLTEAQEKKILREIYYGGAHGVSKDGVVRTPGGQKRVKGNASGFYDYNDLAMLQRMSLAMANCQACLRSLDDLLEKDRQREEDGFPRKIRVGRMIKPGKGGKDRIVVVPTTVEEKFIHDTRPHQPGQGSGTGGSGDGQEGEVVGEEPIHGTQGSGTGTRRVSHRIAAVDPGVHDQLAADWRILGLCGAY